MSESIIVALLALAGTTLGSLAGVLTANKLTNYRISELEKKVDKHNSVMERTSVLERDVQTAYVRLDELREDIYVLEGRGKEHK